METDFIGASVPVLGINLEIRKFALILNREKLFVSVPALGINLEIGLSACDSNVCVGYVVSVPALGINLEII